MHPTLKLSKHNGFTALELIIVLVVGFSIIALSASKMGELFSASSTTQAITSILDLYTAAHDLRGPSGYGENDLAPILVQAKMVPKGLTVSGTTIKNQWNGDITIATNITDGVGFDISYPKIPTEACTKLTESLLGSGNFASIKVGDQTFSTSDPDKNTPAKIVTACSSSTKGITLVFSYRE